MDKAANNQIKQEQELGGTKAYELQILADEKSLDNDQCCQTTTKFAA